MTHLDNTARTFAAATDRVRTGPTLIDPRDFKQVAGGSPKGGWMEPVSSQMRNIQSPKGGW